MKVEVFDLKLIKEDERPYIGGDDIKGQIIIQVREPVQITRLTLRLQGESQTAWIDKYSEIMYKSKEYVLNEYIDLTSELQRHCTESMLFHEGKHVMNFRTKLPLDVISSLERDNLGYVKYACVAVLDIPEGGDSELVAECDFRVVSFLNLDAPYLRESASDEERVHLIGYCCRKPKGFIRAKMEVTETGILPGETVRLNVTFENTIKKRKRKKTPKCALISLCQQLDFRAESTLERGRMGERSITIALKSQGACKSVPGKGPEDRQIDFDVPDHLPPTSIKAHGLVTVSYFFRLDMEHFDVIVPVVIGSVKTIGSQIFH
ncbi:unnamed protein product [Bursaphelenchus xylophilus]|uniref:(pine wood nematode) hypothetical protein n=1 Tax=Bursaphelenchus xylophilus TaxID=6326 RepID=A0A1I7S4U1_BURXY|nr:unnamed protein product [Bursaphelenchus xylophilus]CAG9117376.1 unnamed protein product [Bursaphelenchus xylophilus]